MSPNTSTKVTIFSIIVTGLLLSGVGSVLFGAYLGFCNSPLPWIKTIGVGVDSLAASILLLGFAHKKKWAVLGAFILGLTGLGSFFL